MAKKKKNQFDVHALSDGLSEREVFKHTWREPAAADIFRVPFEDPDDDVVTAVPERIVALTKSPYTKRLLHTQTLLLGGIVLVVAMLAYSLLRVPVPRGSYAKPDPCSVSRNESVVATSLDPEPVDPNAPLAIPSALSGNSSQVGISTTLLAAESLYGQMLFKEAYRAYHQLHEELLTKSSSQDMADFFVLRMALCAKGLGQEDVETQLLSRAAQSESLVVRAMARYHQCLTGLRDGHYLKATTWAYQALALLDGFSGNAAWSQPLRLNCRFLICRAMTMETLAFHDADSDLPDAIWRMDSTPDPFLGLDEAQLQSLLAQGRATFDKALLGPRFKQTSGTDQGILWEAVSHGASLEEVLVRFSANAQMDLDWAFDVTTGKELIETSTKRRPVHMFATNASAQEVVEFAGGCAQLFVEIDYKGTIHLIDPDPAACPTLSACVQRWDKQTFAVWQRLRQWDRDEQYMPNAHFGVGLLREAMRRPSEAIAEYRLLADRFGRSVLAPYALLRSSRIKIEMRDFIGARDDLKLLVDQYPDVEFSGEATLYLADASYKAGRFTEAFRLYSKVSNQGLAKPIGLAATLGAASCRYDQGYYEDAVRWIDRHLDMMQDQPQSDRQPAQLLLGKSLVALGNQDLACEYLKKILTNPRNEALYQEALDAYVKGRMAQKKFVDALHALSGAHPWPLGQERENELAIVKARVYHAMGLMGKAISLLDGQLLVMPQRLLKSEAYFEMGLCSMALEDYEKARHYFAEVMTLSEAGDLLNTTVLEMARACSALDKMEAATDFCQQVLGSKPNPTLQQETLKLLAQLYRRQNRFDLATQALLNQLPVRDPNQPSSEVIRPGKTALSKM